METDIKSLIRYAAIFLCSLFVLLLVAFPGLSAEVEICAKASGRAAVSLIRQHNDAAVDFANKFTSDKRPWIYIRQLTREERRAAWESIESDPLVVLEGSKTPIWFIQSNNQKAASSGYKLHDGLALEMETEDQSTMFGSPVMQQLASMTPELVIIDSEQNFDQIPFDARTTLVLKTNPRSDSDALNRGSVFAALSDAVPTSVSIINLMPLASSEAEAWTFNPFQADLYSSAGRSLVADLRRFGYEDEVTSPHSKSEFQSSIEQATKSKKLVLLIGESSDDGLSLRIPSSGELIKSEDLNTLGPDKIVLGLFCNSSHALNANNTAAVVGTLYSNKTRKLLQATLDSRPAPSVAEFAGVLDNSVSVSSAAPGVSLHSKLAGVMAGFLDSVSAQPGNRGIPLVLVSGSAPGLQAGFASIPPPPPQQPAPTAAQTGSRMTPSSGSPAQSQSTTPNQNDTGGIGIYFLVGVFGGGCERVLSMAKTENE